MHRHFAAAFGLIGAVAAQPAQAAPEPKNLQLFTVCAGSEQQVLFALQVAPDAGDLKALKLTGAQRRGFNQELREQISDALAQAMMAVPPSEYGTSVLADAAQDVLNRFRNTAYAATHIRIALTVAGLPAPAAGCLSGQSMTWAKFDTLRTAFQSSVAGRQALAVADANTDYINLCHSETDTQTVIKYNLRFGDNVSSKENMAARAKVRSAIHSELKPLHDLYGEALTKKAPVTLNAARPVVMHRAFTMALNNKLRDVQRAGNLPVSGQFWPPFVAKGCGNPASGAQTHDFYTRAAQQFSDQLFFKGQAGPF